MPNEGNRKEYHFRQCNFETEIIFLERIRQVLIMNFIKQIERIKKMHLLISTEKTGSPDAFARKLQLSRRQLYNELEIIKNLDATIKYSKKRESFYYGETRLLGYAK